MLDGDADFADVFSYVVTTHYVLHNLYHSMYVEINAQRRSVSDRISTSIATSRRSRDKADKVSKEEGFQAEYGRCL